MKQQEQQGLFVVDLSALGLPQETNERISKSIQKAVLVELASVDEAPTALSLALRPPFGGRDRPWPDWIDMQQVWGMWIDIRDLEPELPS